MVGIGSLFPYPLAASVQIVAVVVRRACYIALHTCLPSRGRVLRFVPLQCTSGIVALTCVRLVFGDVAAGVGALPCVRLVLCDVIAGVLDIGRHCGRLVTMWCVHFRGYATGRRVERIKPTASQ